MNLVGRQFRRGVLLHVVGVPRLPVGQCRPRHAAARLRQVFVAHEITQALVGGQQLAVEHPGVLGSESLTVGRGETRRKLLDRRVVLAVLRLRHDHRVELTEHLFHDGTRLHDTLGRALPHVDDRLVHPDDQPVQPLQPAFVVLDRRERLRVGARTQRGHHGEQAAGLVDRQQVKRKPLAPRFSFPLVQEDVVRDAVRWRERIRVERADRREVLLVHRARGGQVLRTDRIRQLIVVAMVADVRREQGVGAQVVLEIILEERIEPLPRVGRRRRQLRVRRLRAGRGRGRRDTTLQGQGHGEHEDRGVGAERHQCGSMPATGRRL